MVGGEAIRSLIQTILPSFSLTCGTVHCLDERWFFSSLCAVVFLRFCPSNARITQCNSRYWYIFPFQGSQCKLYRAHPKKLRPWLCQLTVAFSDASDGFHRLHATQLTATSTPEWNDGSISRTFSLRSSITIFKTCLIFSGVTDSFGLAERSASFVSVRPRLKSAYHRQIVVFDGAQSG